MRQPEHSAEKIIEAGLEIAAAGKKVTKFAIRTVLGGGNTDRIGKIWNEYLQNSSPSNPKPVPDLPSEVSELVEEKIKLSADGIWSLAKHINCVSAQGYEIQHAETLRTMDELKKMHAAEVHDANVALDEADNKLFQAQERELVLREQLNRAQENEARLRDTSAQQAGQIVELKAELIALHAKLTPLQN